MKRTEILIFKGKTLDYRIVRGSGCVQKKGKTYIFGIDTFGVFREVEVITETVVILRRWENVKK